MRVPSDITGILTLYWAWRWETILGRDPNLPGGKDEWYTSCLDINVTADGAPVEQAGSPPLLMSRPLSLAMSGARKQSAIRR